MAITYLGKVGEWLGAHPGDSITSPASVTMNSLITVPNSTPTEARHLIWVGFYTTAWAQPNFHTPPSHITGVLVSDDPALPQQSYQAQTTNRIYQTTHFSGFGPPGYARYWSAKLDEQLNIGTPISVVWKQDGAGGILPPDNVWMICFAFEGLKPRPNGWSGAGGEFNGFYAFRETASNTYQTGDTVTHVMDGDADFLHFTRDQDTYLLPMATRSWQFPAFYDTYTGGFAWNNPDITLMYDEGEPQEFTTFPFGSGTDHFAVGRVEKLSDDDVDLSLSWNQLPSDLTARGVITPILLAQFPEDTGGQHLLPILGVGA